MQKGKTFCWIVFNLFFKSICRGILNLFLDSRNLQLNIYLEKSRNLEQYCLLICAVKQTTDHEILYLLPFSSSLLCLTTFLEKNAFKRDFWKGILIQMFDCTVYKCA